MRLQRRVKRGHAFQRLAGGGIPVNFDPVGGQDRLLLRQAAVLLVLVQEVLRVVLAFLDVRLVEGVDSQKRAGHGGRDLPQKKFLAEIDEIGQFDPDDGMAGLLQRRDVRILRSVRAA